jgi:chemotaxis protein methyltransferase CheR
MNNAITAPIAGNLMAEPRLDGFSAHNFDRLSRLIHLYSGIKMPAGKKTMVATRLRSRLITLEIETIDAYCDYLFDSGTLDREIVHLINAVSTNKTDFFREPVHFDFLRDVVLPGMLAAGQRQVRVWSAAASIGAEAYSAAMVLEEFRRTRQGPDYAVLGTDISTDVLAVAVAGQFPEAMLEPAPPELRHRYVMKARDPARGVVRIAAPLRAKTSWARLNLMDDHYPVGREMDVIFCRNILIYFDKPAQTHVLTQLCNHLRPGGYLILGHSETGAGTDLPLVSVMNTIFQKS